MDDDRIWKITEETFYYRFTILRSIRFSQTVHDRRIENVPILLINTSFVACNASLSTFTFRQLISHRRFHDISLSFCVSLTSSVNCASMCVKFLTAINSRDFDLVRISIVDNHWLKCFILKVIWVLFFEFKEKKWTLVFDNKV